MEKCILCESCKASVLEFLIQHGTFSCGDHSTPPQVVSPTSSMSGKQGSTASSCSLFELSDSEYINSLPPSLNGSTLLLRGPFSPITPEKAD